MGWKGHGFGLGKTQQGIAEPIELEVNKCRLGFGCSSTTNGNDKGIKQNNNNNTQGKLNKLPKNKDLISSILNILSDFKHSEAQDLVFEKTLSSDGKRLIQKHANKLGLKIRYERFEENRFLVVKKFNKKL
jgi:hypothetical protein